MSNWPLIRETLPSGLRLVLLPRSERQVVTFMVLIGVGSRYETEEQSGLSHFLEHMFFKGTERRPKTEQIAEAIEKLGGAFNAFTSEEVTAYHVTCAAEHLAEAAEVVADILLRPLFPAEEIERERGVITEEIRMYTGIPMRHIDHLWTRALYGGHPLGRRVDGSEATVAALQRADFSDYVDKHYHTGNTVVSVAGKFEPAVVRSLTADLFKSLPMGAATVPEAAPEPLPRQRVVSERRTDLEQTQLMVGVPGLSLKDERRWAGELLAAILGGGMSSRLFLSVRERAGLAYVVRTSLQLLTDTGSLVTQAGVRTEAAAKAAKLILAEYDKIQQELVLEEELNKVKEMTYGHMMLGLEETTSLATAAGGEELLEDQVLTPQEIKEKLWAVSREDIRQVAQELLAPPRRALAVLGPQPEMRAFEEVIVN
jgi:predicted Zn-dependent peptidase